MSHLFLSPLMLLFCCFHFSSELQNELIPAPHLKRRRHALNKLHCSSLCYETERRRTSRCKVRVLSRRAAKSASSFSLVWLRWTRSLARSSILALSSSRSSRSSSKALSLRSNWKILQQQHQHQQRQPSETLKTATRDSNEMLNRPSWRLFLLFAFQLI